MLELKKHLVLSHNTSDNSYIYMCDSGQFLPKRNNNYRDTCVPITVNCVSKVWKCKQQSVKGSYTYVIKVILVEKKLYG